MFHSFDKCHQTAYNPNLYQNTGITIALKILSCPFPAPPLLKGNNCCEILKAICGLVE
jgi:hypothetical protein